MKNKNFLSGNFFLRIFLISFLFFSQNIFAENEVVNSISEAEKKIEEWILPFWDVSSDNPARDAILELYRRNIITWYEDQTFRPGTKISRAEFVKIVLWATACEDCTRPTEEIKQEFTEIPFPDVMTWDWYFYCVSIWKRDKIITWYLSDWYFRPHRNIARWEAVAILLRKVWAEISEYNWEFHDVKEEYWFKDYIKTAVEIWLISEKDGYVNPLEEITRWEFAMITSNLLSIYDCKETDLDSDWIRDFLQKENWIWEWKWWDDLSNLEQNFIDWVKDIFDNKWDENIENNDNENLNNKDEKISSLKKFFENSLEKIKCIFIEDLWEFEYQWIIKNSDWKVFSVTEEKF